MAIESLKRSGFNRLGEPPPPPELLRFGWAVVGMLFLALVLLQIFLLL
jgi:hypothetical protein